MVKNSTVILNRYSYIGRRNMLLKSMLELRGKYYSLDLIAINPDEPNHKREGAKIYSAQIAKQGKTIEA
jgi:hypothetical protein